MKRFICFNCQNISTNWGTGHCPKCDVYPLMTKGDLSRLLEELTNVENELEKKRAENEKNKTN